jgi:hypothetical protein
LLISCGKLHGLWRVWGYWPPWCENFMRIRTPAEYYRRKIDGRALGKGRVWMCYLCFLSHPSMHLFYEVKNVFWGVRISKPVLKRVLNLEKLHLKPASASVEMDFDDCPFKPPIPSPNHDSIQTFNRCSVTSRLLYGPYDNTWCRFPMSHS